MPDLPKPYVKPAIVVIPVGSEKYDRILETLHKEHPELCDAMKKQSVGKNPRSR